MVRSDIVFILLFIWPLFLVNFDLANSRVISKHDVLHSRGDCVNCTICPYPCHSTSPPPPPSSGYPLYGAPPPPASIYPSYGAPPPPPQAQGNKCPPVPAQCCYYPAPPGAPNTYTYFPNDNFAPSPFANVSLVSILMLLASFAELF